MTVMPSLFLSHGSPMLTLTDCPARDFLAGLGAAIGRPKAILCVSAHWEQPVAAVTGAARLETIHDFFGFPPALYAERYDVPGDPALAGRVAAALEEAGIQTVVDPARGIDHGAWVPLKLIYPDGDVPVIQVAIGQGRDTAYHRRLGEALRGLRQDGVLVAGSGAITHNLHAFRGQPVDAPPAPWVADFRDWMADAIETARWDDLLAYRSRQQNGAVNHPTEDHIMPLFAAIGAGSGQAGKLLHHSYTHSILAMDAFRFD
ncbi:DODA-type extradiol aromatic ring-opening family dioxygenase [Hwanghaeella sp.]|uniref:DODA-type extradiol aromatic ring-opening family dioxygenase n=1 Tax=Hwanghaeella sp. TaxID=2605943 RepID=UPI003CCB83A5